MATRLSIDLNLFADLVERRIESPEVEYKNWMPLSTQVERANVARHICALANLGGGWLVFGFEDDGTPATPCPPNLDAYNQDAINGITSRYLQPQPHCEVHHVTARSGVVYPVVRVPSHGVIPICAKSDGPQERGRPQGISKGVHYVRTAGPKSEPINSPDLWRDVLRRCVIAERTSLLSSIGQLFDRPQLALPEASPLQPLVEGHLSKWASKEREAWPVDLAANRIAFGFRLIGEAGAVDPINLRSLERAIRESSAASGDLVGQAEGSFDPGWNLQDRAVVTLVDGRDAYGCSVGSPAGSYKLPSEWLVRDDGMGVEILAFPEDNPWNTEAIRDRGRTRPWPAGERISLTMQIRMMAQRVLFVGKLAQGYPDARQCELVVDILGLSKRERDEFRPSVPISDRRTPAVDGRNISMTTSVVSLTANLAQITADLVSPIFRLFDGADISADKVRQVLDRER